MNKIGKIIFVIGCLGGGALFGTGVENSSVGLVLLGGLFFVACLSICAYFDYRWR